MDRPGPDPCPAVIAAVGRAAAQFSSGHLSWFEAAHDSRRRFGAEAETGRADAKDRWALPVFLRR